MTQRNVEERICRHRAFLNRANSAPLVCFTVGAGTDSWSYWQANKVTARLWGKPEIHPEDIDPAGFVEDQLRYLEVSDTLEDDAFRTAMPFASMPWLEAVAGCPIGSTDTHFYSRPFLSGPEQGDSIVFDPENPWVKKYVEFLDIYAEAFGDRHPVAQSVLRGPSDLAGALLGTQEALEALMLEPEAMERLIDRLGLLIEQFIRHQLRRIPMFHGGQVIGQYEIWAPGTVQRMQEDGATMYSPALYRRFLKPVDERLAAVTDYTLIHLHAPALVLIGDILEVPSIRIFQATKDEGGTQLERMMPGLEKIQAAGRCLVVKGRMTEEDVSLLKQKLAPEGLCIQPVVNSVADAGRMLPGLREWRA